MILGKFKQLAMPTRLTLLHLSGVPRFGGGKLNAIYIGNGANLQFLEEFFFATAQRTTIYDRLYPWGFKAKLRPFKDRVDLALLELPPLWTPWLSQTVRIRVPAWLRQEIFLPETRNAQGWLLPRSVERECARQIRRHSYEVDFINDADSLLQFFREFYRPYVQSRFGAGAYVDSETQFMARHQGQMLARLYSQSAWLLGVMLQRRGDTLRFGRFGARHNPPPPGASEVLDHFVIQHMHQQGVRRVVMGDTRPCLSDGVFRYKARFGAVPRPTLMPQATLGIDIYRWSDTLVQILMQQPLLRWQQGSACVWKCTAAGQIALAPWQSSDKVKT